MTSLIAWIGADSRGPASVYLASDSRITIPWGGSGSWDCGRKVFTSHKYPDILAYCGDVLFPSLVLGAIVDLIDSDLLFFADDSPVSRFSKISDTIKSSFEAYPTAGKRPFDIIYCTREHSGMAAVFHVTALRWTEHADWDEEAFAIERKSEVIRFLGSGSSSLKGWYAKWDKALGERTSRAAFGSFCESLESGEDEHTGGPPQLVGLYREGPARTFGVINGAKRYLLGLPSDTVGGVKPGRVEEHSI